MHGRKVALITACGNKKESRKLPAGKIYKSARIRHLYRRSKELKVPFLILSAKYGLIEADKEIEPYNAVMDKQRCKELKEQIKKSLKKYEVIVFFRGGARKDYYECLKEACKEAGVKLISFGSGNMKGIRELPLKLKEAGFEPNGRRLL
ncbi:DUF6884 domain-containing protein [Thermovibrio sp.]